MPLSLNMIDEWVKKADEEEAQLEEQEQAIALMEKRAKFQKRKRKAAQKLQKLLQDMGGDPREGAPPAQAGGPGGGQHLAPNPQTGMNPMQQMQGQPQPYPGQPS